MPGTLFVVATPLGNLQDLTPRALDTLRGADLVACEDTRRTARLLAHHEIRVPTVSCHKFNEAERIAELLARVRDGAQVALVSDGGTPGISDPGARLVRAALDAGLTVRPLPGASAVATLLSASGLEADRFVFEGFLPQRAGERRRRLRELAGETRTLVLYESPHRIRETLVDLEQVFGAERRVVLGRELTKLHEQILCGTPAELLDALAPEVRGEVTLAVAGAPPGARAADLQARELLERWREVLARRGGDRRKALREMARELEIDRSELYRRLTELGEAGD